MNRIISIRSLALAITLAASLASLGCASESIGSDEIEVGGQSLTPVDVDRAEKGQVASQMQGDLLLLTSQRMMRLGPSPEPRDEGNSSGPSPVPWHTRAPDPSRTGSGNGGSDKPTGN